MKIILDHHEIMEAIQGSVLAQISVAPDKEIGVEITLGDVGNYQAIITIEDSLDEEEDEEDIAQAFQEAATEQKAPRKRRRRRTKKEMEEARAREAAEAAAMESEQEPVAEEQKVDSISEEPFENPLPDTKTVNTLFGAQATKSEPEEEEAEDDEEEEAETPKPVAAGAKSLFANLTPPVHDSPRA